NILYGHAHRFKESYFVFCPATGLCASQQITKFNPGFRACNETSSKGLQQIASFGEGRFSLINDDTCMSKCFSIHLAHLRSECAYGVDMCASFDFIPGKKGLRGGSCAGYQRCTGQSFPRRGGTANKWAVWA